MSNQPDRYEKFVVPDGVPKIDFVKDTKLPNAGTFVIQREDHTVGNMLRMQLHKDPAVTFAGYKIPHPLEYQLLVKVRTDGTKTPLAAAREALQHLDAEIGNLRTQFQSEKARVGNQNF